MKKILFINVLAMFFALFGFSWSASAQDEIFTKGDKVIQLGIGLGNYISYSGYSNKVLPISASFEYGVVSLFDGKGGIGVGGYLAYTSFGDKLSNGWSVSDLIIGPRGNFHYQFVDNLDTYGGLMIAYDIVSYSQKDANLSGSSATFGIYAGARYYFTKNVAVFGELGYGVSPLQLGISFKF